MSLRILLTRAEPGASATAAALVARGARALKCPVLEIRPHPDKVGETAGAQALVFTSSAGAAAFAASRASRAPPAYCVGDATAAAARAAGFARVHSANGDVDTLAALIARELSPAAGPIIHLSGADAAGDLAAALAAHGFAIERRIIYEAAPSAALPDPIVQALRADPPALDIVLFHSPRGAETFCRLAAVSAPNATARLTAACLSPAIARAASLSPWNRTIVAPAPREEALLDAVLAQPASKA